MHRQVRFSIWFPIVLVAAFAAGYLFWQQTLLPGPYDLEPMSMVKNHGAASVDTSGWQIYRNEKYGFEFRYPPDRNLVREDNDRRIIFRESDGLARITIGVVDNSRLESPQSYGLNNYKLASDPQILESELLINGNPATSFKHPEISGITYYVAWSGHEGRIFIIFLDLGKDTNQHVISSLKFKDF